MRIITRFPVAALLGLCACTGGGDDGGGSPGPEGTHQDPLYCDAAELTDALAAASAGETVRVGECRVEGSFTVPTGVTLAGVDRTRSSVVPPAGQPAIVLTPGSPASAATDLAVETDGHFGVVAAGAGAARLERVDVHVVHGVGVGAEGLTSIELTDVAIRGPVTQATADAEPLQPTPQTAATHGLVLVRVGTATLANVTTGGFSLFGALLVESTTTWAGGGSSENLGTGIMVQAGSATLQDLEVCRTFQGVRLYPAYGAVFAGNATIATSGLDVCESARYGLMHQQVSARHTNLVARDNGDAAVWVQNSSSFELSGQDSRIEGNRFAGVVIVDSSNVSVRDARIDNSSLTTRVFGEAGSIEVGDGVQLVRSTQGVELRNLALTSNERVGVLVDLGGEGSTAGLQLDGVTVDGTGSSLGVIAQQGTVTAGWDAGVTRGGATATNDLSFTGFLDIVGAVSPDNIPTDAGAAAGLAGLIGG